MIPLVGSYNTRNNRALPASFDQRFVNFIPQIVTSPLGKSTVYQEKRQGAEINATISAGKRGFGILLWSLASSINSTLVEAFGNGVSVSTQALLYSAGVNLTNLGGFDSITEFIDITLSEMSLSNTATVVALIQGRTGSGTLSTPIAAYYQTAVTGAGFTGDLHSNTTVDNISPSTATLRVGQLVTHANIPAGTRIATISSATAITITAAATATASGQTISNEFIAKIISANFPTTAVGMIVELDGWPFVMGTDANIYNANLNTLDTWTAGNKIPCQSRGNGIAAVRYRDFIVGFTLKAVEFFENVGNPSGSPLRRVANGMFRVGANYHSCIAASGDNVAWIGSAPDSPPGVYMLEGVGVKKISSSTIDKILSQTAFVGENASLDWLSTFGKKILILTGQYANASPTVFCYCPDDKAWFEWVPGGSIYPTYVAAGLTSSQLFFVSRQVTSGSRYTISPTDTSPQFTDDGNAYTGMIITAPLANEKPVIVPRLDVIADTQATTSNLSVSVSRDGYASYETARTVDLSQAQKRLNRLGLFRQGVILKLEHAANTPCRLQGIDMPGMQELTS